MEKIVVRNPAIFGLHFLFLIWRFYLSTQEKSLSVCFAFPEFLMKLQKQSVKGTIVDTRNALNAISRGFLM